VKRIVKRSAFQIQIAVIHALFLREIQTRFGTKSLGYLWALVDPMAKILVFSVIHSFLSTAVSYDMPVFLATGFLAYNLFNGIINKSMEAFTANKALFSYKQVKPIDTIIARTLVEFLVVCMATFIFVCIGIYFDFDVTVKDINMVFVAVVWLIFFAIGLGLFFAVIGSFFENFKKIANLAMLPLFFMSGLFYTVDSLPPLAREYIVYNPVIHFIELLHSSYFHTLNDCYVNYEYMVWWTIVPLFFGLYFYRRTEHKILAS